jgi:hypothetical protein
VLRCLNFTVCLWPNAGKEAVKAIDSLSIVLYTFAILAKSGAGYGVLVVALVYDVCKKTKSFPDVTLVLLKLVVEVVFRRKVAPL